MDLAGIEPASESLSLAVSPITVADLTFPPQYAHRQAYCFSSFMIHLPGQSLPGKVSHIVDTRFPKCECPGADEQQLRLLTRTVRLRLYLVSRLIRSPGVCGWLPQLQSPRRNQYKPWYKALSEWSLKVILVYRRYFVLVLLLFVPSNLTLLYYMCEQVFCQGTNLLFSH